ncbi:DUF1579 domain-containing protein [Ensifer adhaerens]|uniref:DUF1579 domain-containing protein n=1 Tax=Ensifer adhaerens TaxID=106592 RepID=UPI0023A992C1|nr:DUF1579 domain-containing protein [Ensifer adhaerens]WDZ76057.1 DUF1579 domain-containing protein [Ensifer adhaerens]
MRAEPEEAHRWLEQLLGDWQVRTSGPDNEPDRSGPWTEHVRSLQGLWIVCEGQGTMPGGSSGETLMTLGYNPETKRYVGTWVGSMLTHMWVYDGELDAQGKSLSLYCEGPDFENPGKTARYRDIITLIDQSRRLLTAQVQAAGGSWKDMMTAEYLRSD